MKNNCVTHHLSCDCISEKIIKLIKVVKLILKFMKFEKLKNLENDLKESIKDVEKYFKC